MTKKFGKKLKERNSFLDKIKSIFSSFLKGFQLPEIVLNLRGPPQKKLLSILKI